MFSSDEYWRLMRNAAIVVCVVVMAACGGLGVLLGWWLKG